jgi:hypothetical protein
MESEIRIAAASEAKLVSEILSEAAGWLEARGVPLWSPHQVSLPAVSPEVQNGVFFLAWLAGVPVGTMRLTTSDPAFWPEAAPGEALYLHRLAVRRAAAGGRSLLIFCAGRCAAPRQSALATSASIVRPFGRVSGVCTSGLASGFTANAWWGGLSWRATKCLARMRA